MEGTWLSELGLESSCFIQECHMDLVDSTDDLDIAAAIGEVSSIFGVSPMDFSGRPAEQLSSNSWDTCTTNHKHFIASNSSSSSISSPKFLCFGNSNSSPSGSEQLYGSPNNDSGNFIKFPSLTSIGSYENENGEAKCRQGQTKRVSTMTRSPSHAQDHLLAERKRREKLSQRFIALSAIIPGLKKMDKASILGDAIKYMKQLQEGVKTLEEQTQKTTIESVVFVKKSQLPIDDDDDSSSNENFNGPSNEPLPEIEARVSDKNILIRIHCEKHKGSLVKVLGEIEKLNLSVLSSSVMPFGTSTLDITVIAEMDNEFSKTVKDLLRDLRLGLVEFM